MSRIALLAATLAGTLPAALPAQETSTHRLAGNEVAIYDIVGQVTVRSGSGPDVVVEITRTGRDAGRLTIDVSPVRGIPALRVLFPEDRIVYPAMGRNSRTSFWIHSDGTWGDHRGHKGRREGREITVRGDGQGLEAVANLTVSIPPGKRTSIYLGTGGIDASNVTGTLSLDAMSGHVRVTGGSGALDIDTGSGDIAVSGTVGDLALDTGSGEVSVQGARGASLKIDTGSGSVTGGALSFSSTVVESGSGNIELDAVTGPRVNLETGSGDIEVRLTQNPEQLDVSTGSGRVLLRVPETVSATIDLETGSGEFEVDFPMQLIRKSEDSLRGRIGEGKGRISIESGSGDIRISK